MAASSNIFGIITLPSRTVHHFPSCLGSRSLPTECYIHMFDALVRRAAPAVMTEFTAKELQSLLARSTQHVGGSKGQPDPLLI